VAFNQKQTLRAPEFMSEQESSAIASIAYTEDFYSIGMMNFRKRTYLWFIHRRGNHLRTDNDYDAIEASRLYTHFYVTGGLEKTTRIVVLHMRTTIEEKIHCTIVRHINDKRPVPDYTEFPAERIPTSPLLVQLGMTNECQVCRSRVRTGIEVDMQRKRQLEILAKKYKIYPPPPIVTAIIYNPHG